MTVHLLAPTDDGAFADWYAVLEASQSELRELGPPDTAQEVRAEALEGQDPEAASRSLLLVVRSPQGRVVGAARLDLPRRDNPHLAVVEHFYVAPDARRRGHGSALLTEVVARARADGRTSLLIGMEESAAEAAGERQAPGRAFAQARGLRWAHGEVQRDLDLPVPDALLTGLEEQSRPYAVGYALRAWTDRCPDDLVEGRALLGRRMSTDAPSGDVPLQEEQWDAERVRRREETWRRAGRQVLAVGAVHEATGQLVAFTELARPTPSQGHAFQWETLVLREHRGHRLGTLVKLENLRRAARQWPDVRVVSTWNDPDNRPMVAVNEALGCRVNGASSEWVLDL